MSRNRRPYGCLAFLFDLFMIFLSMALLGGFPAWLIWIFIREMRR